MNDTEKQEMFNQNGIHKDTQNHFKKNKSINLEIITQKTRACLKDKGKKNSNFQSISLQLTEQQMIWGIKSINPVYGSLTIITDGEFKSGQGKFLAINQLLNLSMLIEGSRYEDLKINQQNKIFFSQILVKDLASVWRVISYNDAFTHEILYSNKKKPSTQSQSYYKLVLKERYLATSIAPKSPDLNVTKNL
ncbi:hypothetical protein ABPG74_012106 [Tetrahymena malaccensis]